MNGGQEGAAPYAGRQGGGSGGGTTRAPADDRLSSLYPRLEGGSNLSRIASEGAALSRLVASNEGGSLPRNALTHELLTRGAIGGAAIGSALGGGMGGGLGLTRPPLGSTLGPTLGMAPAPESGAMSQESTDLMMSEIEAFIRQ